MCSLGLGHFHPNPEGSDMIAILIVGLIVVMFGVLAILFISHDEWD